MAANQTFTFQLPALRVLENEHHYLSYLMADWHVIVLNFENRRYSLEEGREALLQLRQMIIDFIEPLKNHTDKKETYVFPMLAKYVGNDQGPVLAVEEEHEEIDAYIGHFLHHTRGDLSQFTLQMMEDVVKDAGEAFEVITVHFIKEANIVFPMAESILRQEEQEELFKQLYTTILPD